MKAADMFGLVLTLTILYLSYQNWGWNGVLYSSLSGVWVVYGVIRSMNRR